MGKFIVVDCEANGPVPGLGDLTEFGAVYFHDTTKRFHGVLTPIWKDKQKPGARNPKIVMQEFAKWIYSVVGNERPIFISDNPSYDFMWIAYYFITFTGRILLVGQVGE